MKIFCAIFVVLCVILCSHAFDREEAEELAREILTSCKEKEGGTDADYAKLIKIDYPVTPAGNCMVACAHEKMGLFDNGEFMKENFMGLLKLITNNDPDLNRIGLDLTDICGKIRGERCEQAINFYHCLEAEAKKLGIERPEIL